MKYIAIVMFLWYLLITAFTIYGMAKEKRAPKFDVFIGFILAPALSFFAAFLLWGS